TVTEGEVNSYILLEARAQVPTGVVEPYITIVGGGRVSGRAVVDLDAVRKEKNPTSLLDPMNYLMGRLPVTATGVLHTTNAGARRPDHDQRRGAVRARIGRGQRHPGSEAVPAGDGQLLLAHAAESGGDQHRRSVRAAGAHPRDSGGARASHNRAMTAAEVLAT